MPKQVTIAMENRYCQARLKAAEYNEDFASRASAVNHLPGVTEDCLKKYELDITRPPNTAVAIMADAYNDPGLRAWYCANECPLGRDCREMDDMPPERTLLRLQNVQRNMEEIVGRIAGIMDDGILDEGEAKQLPDLRNRLREVKQRAEETMAMLEKAAKRGGFA